MERLEAGSKIIDDIFKVKQFDVNKLEDEIKIGQISERDKFRAAKQILLGLAILYLFTVVAYLLQPKEGAKLLDIVTETFPPLATLILAFYFRDKNH